MTFTGGDFSLLGIALLVFVIGAILAIVTRHNSSKVGGMNFVYGASGFDGTNITLQCPVGKSITVSSTAWVGDARVGSTTSGASSSGIYSNGACEPFNDDGSVNTSMTSSVASLLADACNGKGSCSYVIPPKTPFASPYATGITCGGTGNSMMVATYSCQ